METKKVNVSMIIEIESKAFEDLVKSIDHHIENFVDLDGWPEIQSISDAEIREINDENSVINGIEKREFNNYTVGEVIDILSTFPRDYEFLCCGESDYAIWVDHNSSMVSIDKANWINDQIQNIINNTSLQNNK